VKGAHGLSREQKGVSLRATRSRGGRILSQQGGFQVSEHGERGEQGEQGEQGKQGEQGEQGVNRVYSVFCLTYVTECLQRVNDTSYVHIIKITGANVVDNLNSV
jgi:hypothetical protein